MAEWTHRTSKWTNKIDFYFTFVFCSIHDPDAMKTAGERALLWAKELCVGLFGGRIWAAAAAAPLILCDCGCAAVNWWQWKEWLRLKTMLIWIVRWLLSFNPKISVLIVYNSNGNIFLEWNITLLDSSLVKVLHAPKYAWVPRTKYQVK